MRHAGLALGLPIAAGCMDSDLTVESPSLSERCVAAVSAIDSCGGSTTEFAAACEKATDEDFELIAELADSACESVPVGKVDRIESELFAQVCAPAVASGGLIMRVRNRRKVVQLAADELEELRSYYGDVVDEVTFYFDAAMLNEWELDFADVDFGMGIAGQGFGYRVYLSAPYGPGTHWGLDTVVHEMAHIAEGDAAGGLFPFAYAYCHAFAEAGFDYWPNVYERDACDQTTRFFSQ